MSQLNGWHPGERLIREKLNLDHSTSMLYSRIGGELPYEHIQFHTTRLHFLPVVTLDKNGRPWCSLIAGRDGKTGFIKNPRYNTLTVEIKPWTGDPITENVAPLSIVNSAERKEDVLVAGLGIEYSTRRRNKFAGSIMKAENGRDGTMNLEFSINQALGNCPKYIPVRDLEPYPQTQPTVAFNVTQMKPGDRLPPELISFIEEADIAFFGTVYKAAARDARLYPSHLGFNARSGLPGFVRVKPSDGRTVVLPDFSGNRFMTSLGNVEATPYASLSFVSFITGDILYLTGDAENLLDSAAQAVMPFQNRLTTIKTVAYIYIKDALPVRQRAGAAVQQSPYSPPVRFLAEETSSAALKLFAEDKSVTALLTRVDIHSEDLATFTWETNTTLGIEPGQAAILDFTPLMGKPQYQHMAPGRPSDVNDDRIRTWTVSSFSTDQGSDAEGATTTFSLTMREKPGGLITGALFSIARKLKQFRPESLGDTRPLSISANIIGISGDFTLPNIRNSSDSVKKSTLVAPVRKLLWVAGGIGITPFLSMLSSINNSHTPQPAGSSTEPAEAPFLAGWDVDFVISTREAPVLLALIQSALQKETSQQQGISKLNIEIFSNQPLSELDAALIPTVTGNWEVSVTKHQGRIPSEVLRDRVESASTTELMSFVCGPPAFEETVISMLQSAGVAKSNIKRENFSY